MFGVTIFATIVCALQQVDGTTTTFSICTFFFIFIAALAFNQTGGLTKPSGAFIFAYATLGVTVGICYKIILGEPGQRNLLQPERTIEVQLGTISAMLVAAYMASKFVPKKPWFPQFASNEDLGRASIGCLIVGVSAILLGIFGPGGGGPGSFMSAFNQVNQFLPLAVLLGVTYEIRKSGGRRSVNLQVLIAGFILLANGIMGYTKQGMFGPFLCWLIPATAQRYKVSMLQIGSLLMVFAFITYYLVPYSQFGRTFINDQNTFSQNLAINVYLLSRLPEVRKAYNDDAEAQSGSDALKYFDKPQGFADRLQMLTPDDAIINATENGAVFGIGPTIFAFQNVVPHFIWPAKPTIQFGNIYAHEAGILTHEDDVTTGISFSPAGEAFHQAKWMGILVMLPILFFLLFYIVDSCCGDTRESPIALLAMLAFFHGAPEGGVIFVVQGFTMISLIFFIVAWVCAYLMPMMAGLVVGPAKRMIERQTMVVSWRKRANARAVAEEVQEPSAPESPAPAPVPIYRWSRGRQGT